MKNERNAIIFSVVITLLFTWFGYGYLNFKSQHENSRAKQFIFDLYELVDQRYNDLKLKLRGQVQPTGETALIAIDDDSLREVGRWPWSRDVMAKMTDKLVKVGATAIGFDIVESEPEKAFPQNDEMFGKVVGENADKIVLGAFSENEPAYKPYQDYCVTEAFLASGGDKMIKLNPTIAIDDAEDPYDTLKWNGLFDVIFANVRKVAQEGYLRSINKTSLESLTDFQKIYLRNYERTEMYGYCEKWLTNEDVFKPEDSLPVQSLYEALFKDHPALKDLPVLQAIEKFKADVPRNLVPQNVDWTSNIPVIEDAATYTACFNAYQDLDGYVRKYPLFYRAGNRLGTSYIPSLALQTYLNSKKYRAEIKFGKIGLEQESKGITSFKIYDTQTDPETLVGELPVDPMGRLLVNFYGRQMTLPYVSARDLLTDDETMKIHQSVEDLESHKLNIKTTEVKKADFLKGKSVIVGAVAKSIYDLRSTPIEPNFPGPEIHVTTIANLLEQNFIKRVDGEIYYLTILLLVAGVILSVAWAHFGALISLGSFVILFAVTFITDYMLLLKKGWMTTNVLLLTGLSVLFLATNIFKYFTEERRKKELKSTFSKYVSPAVVDEILQDPENLKLGGRKQRMTVMFSDVRGFTTISEKLPPVELAQLLNDYLSPMTEIVFENKGTLDKYMGDAIMAFFGAPIFYGDHAAHACRCALASLVKLKELQAEFAAKNLPMIDIGIGINTGEMSVGNMGSKIVQSYTVMGDSVNLGSRLEGINKEYGTRIIISEFTHADVKDTFTCREVDRVRVKGKLEPVRIFELIQEGHVPAGQREWLDHFEKGYDLYYKKNFEEARDSFEKVLTLRQDDPVAQLYIERSAEYLVDPPPADWDGVFVMKTK